MSDSLWFLDTLAIPRVAAAEGADGVSVLESRARRGDSPPLHVHAEDEIFHLIEGEMTLLIGGQTHAVRAGDTLLGPRGVPHTYRVDSQEARWLVITAKGDFERFVKSFSRLAPTVDLPAPSGPPTEAQQEALAAACNEHGIDLVGPPLH